MQGDRLAIRGRAHRPEDNKAASDYRVQNGIRCRRGGFHLRHDCLSCVPHAESVLPAEEVRETVQSQVE